MKPFNLEEAKAGKPVCIRTGDKARILAFDIENEDYPIVAAVSRMDGKEDVLSYTINGRYGTGAENSIFDLMMVGEKKKGYVALMKAPEEAPHIAYTTNVYKTPEEASAFLKNLECILAVVPVEWEE